MRQCRPAFRMPLPHKAQKKMQNKNFKQTILQNVEMDTQTSFIANGDIMIYPCNWEADKAPVTADGQRRVNYKAGVAVDEDGKTLVKRYNIGKNGSKYEVIYETAHAEVKMTRPWKQHRFLNREKVIVDFKFPRKYPLSLMKLMFYQECEQIMAFLNSRKEDTLWKD